MNPLDARLDHFEQELPSLLSANGLLPRRAKCSSSGVVLAPWLEDPSVECLRSRRWGGRGKLMRVQLALTMLACAKLGTVASRRPMTAPTTASSSGRSDSSPKSCASCSSAAGSSAMSCSESRAIVSEKSETVTSRMGSSRATACQIVNRQSGLSSTLLVRSSTRQSDSSSPRLTMDARSEASEVSRKTGSPQTCWISDAK
mmetsp:Transcript_17728/g.38303  ORF Transcript_17728/g.38303 Transcript_17728/m.38303 type:complete len:201 (+) Transcript_17728:2038-2640(+)